MTSDNFEAQTRKHFLMQFGEKATNDGECEAWSDVDENELLSATNVPSFNYWDFSEPRKNRYNSLSCVQKQGVDSTSHNYTPKINYKQSENKNTHNLDRFKNVTDGDLEIYIKEQENRNTSRKTKSDVKIFKTFLTNIHDENRCIENIPQVELDRYLGLFFVSAQKEKSKNGTLEYEPSSLKSIRASIHRYLKDKQYDGNIMVDDEFYKSRQGLTAKFKELKSLGMGNKPNAADPLTDIEINKFYDDNLLGADNPRALQNTVYLNNNYHFGLRGVTEHYNLCWGDITLKVDTNGDEYLQYCKERQTKTRQEDNIGNIRKSGPIAMENKSDGTRCPVLAYKLFSLKRPENMKKTDSPFYIQATIFQDDNIKSKTFWYKNLRLGVKSISKIIKSMAKESLPESNKKLTGHSARKGAIQKQKDAGIQDTEIVQRTGHKNIKSSLIFKNKLRATEKNFSNAFGHQL